MKFEERCSQIEKFAIARRARQHARRVRYPENARRPSAAFGYFAAALRHRRCQIIDHSFLLKIHRPTSNVQLRKDLRAGIQPAVKTNPQESRPDRIGVIDVIGEDPKTGDVVLMMNQPNEWIGSDDQLLELQERFNAYVSFLLDGEMAEAHPELAGKRALIELRCAHMPDPRALELLGLIHDQLAFQQIKLEVVVKNEAR